MKLTYFTGWTVTGVMTFSCWVALMSATVYGQQETTTEESEASAAQEVWEQLSDEAKEAATSLKAQFSPGSEAMAMLETILAGKRMGQDDGWFQMAKPQSLYSFKDLVKWFDQDENGMIEKKEFTGHPSDFDALDRNRDDRLTESDWEWAWSRGSDTYGQVVNRLDADDDGRITRDEIQALAESLEQQGTDSMSLESFRQWLEPPQRPSNRQGPTPTHLVMGLAHQEIGSHQEGPLVGQSAPDFQLKDLDGQPHSLKQALVDKPVVLIFGNFTCGPYRSQSGNVRDLIARYKDRVNFLMVYVREAHPSDGWNMTRNEKQGILIPQPRDYQQRLEIAQRCSRHFDAGIPMLVDDVDDTVGHQYSGMPSRLYLIDQDQTIVYKSGRGPHYFWPSDLENSLVAFLNAPESP